MTFPLVVSFYTENTCYQWQAHDLIASCKQWGLEHHVVGVACKGSWEMNCAYKPFFLYEMLKTFKRPLFWVDADAVFVKAPDVLPVFEKDLAVRLNQELEQTHDSYLLSGSLFVNYSAGGEKILRLWAEETVRVLSDKERSYEFWDQIALRDVTLRQPEGVEVGALPPSYAKVGGRPFDEAHVLEGVIYHHQASRLHKKLENL